MMDCRLMYLAPGESLDLYVNSFCGSSSSSNERDNHNERQHVLVFMCERVSLHNRALDRAEKAMRLFSATFVRF